MKKVANKQQKLLDAFEELLPQMAKRLTLDGEPLDQYPITCALLAELYEEYKEEAEKEQAKAAK